MWCCSYFPHFNTSKRKSDQGPSLWIICLVENIAFSVRTPTFQPPTSSSLDNLTPLVYLIRKVHQISLKPLCLVTSYYPWWFHFIVSIIPLFFVFIHLFSNCLIGHLCVCIYQAWWSPREWRHEQCRWGLSFHKACILWGDNKQANEYMERELKIVASGRRSKMVGE